MAVVIEPFPYSGNGYAVEFLIPGDERDFGHLTAGLIEAGFVSEKPAPKAGASDPPTLVTSGAETIETAPVVEPPAEAAAVEPPKRTYQKRR